MNINYKLIGNKVKAYRTNLNMSQMVLAEKTNLSVPFISYIETGKKRISLDTLIALSNALGVTPNELLSDFISYEDRELDFKLSKTLDDLTPREQRLLVGITTAIANHLKSSNCFHD